MKTFNCYRIPTYASIIKSLTNIDSNYHLSIVYRLYKGQLPQTVKIRVKIEINISNLNINQATETYFLNKIVADTTDIALSKFIYRLF